MGLGRGDTAFASSLYEPKSGADTATGRMLAWLSGDPASRILVMGAEPELLASELRDAGHDVTLLAGSSDDRPMVDGVAVTVADVDRGFAGIGEPFDVVVGLDALGRAHDTDRFLRDVARVCGREVGS